MCHFQFFIMTCLIAKSDFLSFVLFKIRDYVPMINCIATKILILPLVPQKQERVNANENGT